MYFLLGILLIYIVGKLIRIPIKIIGKLIMNGLVGCLLLLFFNFFGSSLGITLPITKLSAVIVGFFGLPGIAVMLIFRYFL